MRFWKKVPPSVLLLISLLVFSAVCALSWKDGATRLWLIPLLLLLAGIHYYMVPALPRIKWLLPVVTTVLIILAGVRLGQFIHKIAQPVGFIEDVAVRNVQAVDLLFRDGKNPYAEKIDPQSARGKSYLGLKYPPLQILTYAPFAFFGGQKGIYWANLLVYLGIVFLIWSLLGRAPPVVQRLALIYYLLADHFFTLAFHSGANDFLPILLVLLAMTASQSPVWLGLSLLAKPLPGGVLAFIWLFQKRFRSLAIATGVFLLGCLPFLLWGPVSFWENVFEFHLLREVRPSALTHGWPPIAAKLVQFAGLGLIGFLVHRSRGVSFGLLTAALFIFLLTAPMAQVHYYTWVVPFLILALWRLDSPA